MSGQSSRRAGAAALVLLTVGCQSPEPPVSTRDEVCNHWYTEGDPGLGAGYDYTEDHHSYEATVPVTLCWEAAFLRIAGSDPRITITPQIRPGPGPFLFTVTVAPGAGGYIKVAVTDASGNDSGTSFGGPGIVTDATGWAFTPWGDDAW